MSAPAAPAVPVVGILESPDVELRRRLAAAGLELTPAEARKIAGLLGRDPTIVEAHIFSTMWSEHCSYKSSLAVLREHLPTEGAAVVIGPGEDAGIVRLAEIDGKSYCVAIAHESHNHPSQIVPNEGAATGIGGIVRDVYCMGADVIGVLDPLRFGDPRGPAAERTREIVHGVVEGIWQYGNALGVPNLGGDVYFDGSFDENCLVNVVAIGLVEESEIVRSRIPTDAATVPYDVILVGKPTDPSGFGGATFASRVLDQGKVLTDKYAVQVPDPFLKRMLTVATFEVMKLARDAGAAVGFKDLGAGGIACATSELAAAAGLGVKVDLSKVVVAEEGMAPEVIACSETQERYCLVVPRSVTEEVVRIYNDVFELPELCHGARAVVIGEALREERYVLEHAGAVVCDAATEQITAGISYSREARERVRGIERATLPPDLDLTDAILRVVGSPNVASREHIYRHYDSEVKGNTVVEPGAADACVVAPIPGESVGVAVAVGGGPYLGMLDPYEAGAAAVAEAVRNVAATGAVPIALTDCLNFGSPEDPEVFHDFVEAVRGVGDAARGIGLKDSDAPVPIVSGNVSFYNQSASGKAIPPSPIICCVGSFGDVTRHLTAGFEGAGHGVYLLGERSGELGASELLRVLGGDGGGRPPRVAFTNERAALAAVTDVAARGLAESCHDVSDGGLVAALVEMVLLGPPDVGLGAVIDVRSLASRNAGEGRGVPATAGDAALDLDEAVRLLFCENGGYLVAIAPESEGEAARVFEARGVWHRKIGETTDDGPVVIAGLPSGTISIARETLEEAWAGGATDVMR